MISQNWPWVSTLKASLLHCACCPMPTLQQSNLYHATLHSLETETASDSLHGVRGWKKVVKNLAAFVFKLLYKEFFMIKWTGFEWKKFKVTQKSKLNRNSGTCKVTWAMKRLSSLYEIAQDTLQGYSEDCIKVRISIFSAIFITLCFSKFLFK